MAGSSPEREVLGTFSINERGEYRNNFSQRRYVVEPDEASLGAIDLRDGIDGYIGRRQEDVRPTSISSSVLKWIHDNREGMIERKILERERGGTRRLNIDFVGDARTFSRLLRACESIDRLEILVTFCNGTYYLETTNSRTPTRREVALNPVPPQPASVPLRAQAPSFVPNASIQPSYPRLRCGGRPRYTGGRSRPPRSARESNRSRASGQSANRRTTSSASSERNERKEIDYARRKFTKCVTSNGEMHGLDEPVNATAKYAAVVRTQYGDHTIILNTDVQAEREDNDVLPPGNYVAIRTRKAQLVGKPSTNFKRYKTLQWWSQTFIAGIPEVMCGMTDDRSRRITSIKSIKVDQLPGMSNGFWNPRTCIKKFRSYLSDIKRMIPEDDPRAVYRLELPEVRLGRGIKDRLYNRKFIRHGPQDNCVILRDQYLSAVLGISSGKE